MMKGDRNGACRSDDERPGPSVDSCARMCLHVRVNSQMEVEYLRNATENHEHRHGEVDHATTTI